MSLFFAGHAYDNEADLAMVIVSSYLSAGGLNKIDEINRALEETNEALIDDIHGVWTIDSELHAEFSEALDIIRKNPTAIL